MDTEKINITFSQGSVDVNEALSGTIGSGGECVFIGTTRPETNKKHGELLALNYDCYKEMAQEELQSLAEEAINRYSVHHIRVTHAIGEVTINKASVVIAVSSDHRDDAFTACRFIIDLLKQRVPIWKQEMWADGTTWSDGTPLAYNEQ